MLDVSLVLYLFKSIRTAILKGVSPKYILTVQDKYKYIEELGVDYLIELDFSKVCHLHPDDYLSGSIS